MLCPSPSRVWARGGRGRSARGFLQRGGAAASAGGGSGSCPPAGRGAGEDGGGIAGLTLVAPLLVASPPSPLSIFSGWEIACWMGGATYRVCSVGRGAPLAQGFFFFFLSAQHRSPCGLAVSGQQRVGLLLVWAHSSVELAEPLLWLVAVLSWLIGLHVASKNPFGAIGRQRRPYCRCHCPIWKGSGQRAGYFFLL